MSVAKELFQLQEVDLEIEAKELAAKRMTAQLGESQELLTARVALAAEQQRLGELSKQQHSLETDIEDLSLKISTSEKDLYSGRIRIPKELSSLQQEIATLKQHRTQLEDKALELMDMSESARSDVNGLTKELRRVEAEWHVQQDKFKVDIEQLKGALPGLKQKQEQLAGAIDASALELYRLLRKQKGAAVARVEQGICRGCRISLPANELQLVRGGRLIQCSSCGRILYLP